MFCPICKDEFRPGFDHCASCDVDLVESLSDRFAAPGDPAGAGEASPAIAASVPGRGPVGMVEYCGFVSLDEARRARDLLRERSVRSEIAIREGPDPGPGTPVVEEFWLRVERDRYREAVAVLGFDDADPVDSGGGDDETFTCGECGADVSEAESFCPGCGARFEAD